MSKFLDKVADDNTLDKVVKQLKLIKTHMEIVSGEEGLELSQVDDDDAGD